MFAYSLLQSYPVFKTKHLLYVCQYTDVFRVNTALREEEDGDMDSISGDIPLLSLASKDSAPADVVSDLLRAEERRKLHVITNVKQRLIEKTVGFHDVVKKHRLTPLPLCTKQPCLPNILYRRLSKPTENICSDYSMLSPRVEQLKWGVS